VTERLNQRTNNHLAKNPDEKEFVFNEQNKLVNSIENTIKIQTNVSPEKVAEK